ncbi:transcriptional regulator GcvA [Teichococcus oryzae]|uniref:Transcriptional regulator GcvA n=1 Tax=Teichococcus oryzae TaxID=1608942 RepID=A0A5B2TGM5_9PROT|nr:transcriptional regulator GcvA [Pseudoroseomonas oryzae]KAA2213339.1 transcriptional regulator GcvA [Pseudoroseomonas oryzae]
MRNKLPPLASLRAFEAAARHLSFARAAEDLLVTPGAVSQQVKQLEDWLGVALFRRLPKGVLLTDAGQLYGGELREVFARLAAASERVRRHATAPVLTISTSPSLAARWLIPRLGEFRARHPDIDVRIEVNPAPTDFARENVDVAIRHGPGPSWPGLHADLLFTDVLFPVCSPRLLEAGPPLRAPADLAHFTLLHEDPWIDSLGRLQDLTWGTWLAAMGAGDVDASRGLHFSQTHMSLQAALAGQGVALGSQLLAGEDLRAGRLVRPLPQEVRGENSYWFVCPEDAVSRPRLAAFRAWLLEEAARERRATVALRQRPRRGAAGGAKA